MAGSVCGRGLSGKPLSTIGIEGCFNGAFGIAEAERFLAVMIENIPPALSKAAERRTGNAGPGCPRACSHEGRGQRRRRNPNGSTRHRSQSGAIRSEDAAGVFSSARPSAWSAPCGVPSG